MDAGVSGGVISSICDQSLPGSCMLMICGVSATTSGIQAIAALKWSEFTCAAAASSWNASTSTNWLPRPARLPGRLGTDLLDAARTAFTHGMNSAALGAAIAVVLAAAASAVFFRGVQVEPAPAAARAAQAEADKELVAS